MDNLHFISSNKNKIDRVSHFLAPLGISFTPISLELEEIQSESIAEIAEHKAEDAFSRLHKPLFVSDHGWFITALNGFPGAYMKYMNKWFTPQDFLNLMSGKENREVFLEEVICYIDEHGTIVFSEKHTGHVLYDVKGEGPDPWMSVSSFSDTDESVAEVLKRRPNAREEEHIWVEFAEWLKQRTNS